MELIRLNETTHIEEARYENYESLAWNEKYPSGGDFQLRSYNVEEVLSFLKFGTLVTVPDSTMVAMVQEITYELSDDGTRMVNVSGNSIDFIFKYRPARWYISAMTDPDRVEGPTEGEYGDPLETEPKYFIWPSDMVYNLVQRIDVDYYGREELKHLKLPFRYTMIKPKNGLIKEEPIPSYELDGGDAMSSIDGLQEFGQFGVTTIRPGSHNYDVYMRQALERGRAEKWGDDYLKNDSRPTLFAMYMPNYMSKSISFSSMYDDYVGATNTVSIDTPNILFRSTEDGVLETRIGEVPSSGLNARIKYEEKAVEKITLYQDVTKIQRFDMAKGFAKENLDANKFSLDMDGYHPFHDKKFGLRPDDDNYYYLGDVVRIDFPWRSGYDVVVSEFVRTADSSGYKEYPTFTPFLTTSNFVDDSPADVHSMAFSTALKYIKAHDSWV